MAAATYGVPVDFAGEGAGVGPLTWSQRGIRSAILRTGRTLNIGGAMPLPPGTTLDEMAAVLRFLVSRHPSLRTLFRPGPTGDVEQEVHGSGRIHLEVVGTDDADDPDAAADRLRARYEDTPFEPASEWPVRMGVVRHRGGLTHVVLMYYHLAVDGDGIDAAVRDLAHLDRSTGQATAPPPPALAPLDLARLQAEPAAIRQSANALRHWERQLRAIPARRFRGSTDPREPRYLQLVCVSPAMRLALEAVAAASGHQSGHVLLAAQAVALARVTGISPAVVQVLVNNRFRPGCADAVCHLTQVGLCVIDVADTTFDAVLARTFVAGMAAYKHGYFDTTQHQQVMARVDRERGEAVDISCFVNDRRAQLTAPSDDVPAAPVAVSTPREARALTTLRWAGADDSYDGSLYLHVDSAPGALRIELWVDTHQLSPGDAEAFLRGLETVLVEAVDDPAAPTGVGSTLAAV